MIGKSFWFFSCIVLMLVTQGCAEEDRIIGEGENTIIFDNQGNTEIAVEVSWTNENDTGFF